MGLDIYVRWDDMSKAEEEAQFTGFADATEAGYLRLNWSGVSFVNNYARENAHPNPLKALFPLWDGSNGEGYEVTIDEMGRLLAERNRLNQWLESAPQNVDDYFKRKVTGAIAMIDFIHAHRDQTNLQIIFG